EAHGAERTSAVRPPALWSRACLAGGAGGSGLEAHFLGPQFRKRRRSGPNRLFEAWVDKYLQKRLNERAQANLARPGVLSLAWRLARARRRAHPGECGRKVVMYFGVRTLSPLLLALVGTCASGCVVSKAKYDEAVLRADDQAQHA